jgi:hypothetical protein
MSELEFNSWRTKLELKEELNKELKSTNNLVAKKNKL